MIRWTMPKLKYDNRKAPLIVVWYDLLDVPYSLRPSINYTYQNFTWTKRDDPIDLSVDEIIKNLYSATIASCILFVLFLGIMIWACIRSDDAVLKANYMLDTRNIRTTYVQSVTTLIAPQSEFEQKSKFDCKKHSPWLIAVVIARLIYKSVFTFTFFGIVFQLINHDSFQIIKQYPQFAHERDYQITNMSKNIESYYYSLVFAIQTNILDSI